MMNIMRRVNWRTVKKVGALVLPGVMAIADEYEKVQLQTKVIKLSKEVAELKKLVK